TQSKAPAISMRKVDRHRIDEFRFSRSWDTGLDRQFAGPNRHQLVDRRPASRMSAGSTVAIERKGVVGEIQHTVQPSDRVGLGRLDALAQNLAAVTHERLVGVLARRVFAVRPAHAPTALATK